MRDLSIVLSELHNHETIKTREAVSKATFREKVIIFVRTATNIKNTSTGVITY